MRHVDFLLAGEGYVERCMVIVRQHGLVRNVDRMTGDMQWLARWIGDTIGKKPLELLSLREWLLVRQEEGEVEWNVAEQSQAWTRDKLRLG